MMVDRRMARLREDYETEGLSVGEAHPDPVRQFGRWLDEAMAAGVLQANAMTLATADDRGLPSARVVLLKGYGPSGFVFYTHFGSRKSEELTANPMSTSRRVPWGLGSRPLFPRRAGRYPIGPRSNAWWRTRKRSSRTATCPDPPIGEAGGCIPNGSSSGRAGATAYMTGSPTSRTATGGERCGSPRDRGRRSTPAGDGQSDDSPCRRSQSPGGLRSGRV